MMKSSQNQKCGTYNPAWFAPSKDNLKENCKVTSVRQPPNPKMAKIKVDQTGLIRREKEPNDKQKHMEALKDEYSANLDWTGVDVAATHHQLWEDWRVRSQQDMAAVAQVRGRHAARRQRGQAFLEKKAQVAAKETREGAKLLERLRAAEIVSRPKLAKRSEVQIVDVAGGELMQVQHKKNTHYVPRVERIPLGDLGNRGRVEGNNQISSVQPKKVEEDKETEEKLAPVSRQECLTHEFNRMMQELDNVARTGLSDSSLSLLSETSLSPAYLSTILEATEDDGGMVSDDTTGGMVSDDTTGGMVSDDTTAQSLALNDVDDEPVRGPSSAEDSANRSAEELSDASTNRSVAQLSSDASTNFNARINRQRDEEQNSEDLDNVRKLLDRIKNQRKIIDERNHIGSGQEEAMTSSARGEATHFKTIEGAAQGEADKNVNREFINKVLNFESNSVLINSRQKYKVNNWTKDSSTSSTNEFTRKTNKKVRKKKKQVVSEPIQCEVNKMKQSENSIGTKDSELRGYIEQLLSMRHEDVADLSVSTLSSNKDSVVSTLTPSLKSSTSTPYSNSHTSLTPSLKSSTSTPYSNSHTSDSSGKKQVRFQFDTTQDESSYLGLPIKGSEINVNASRNSSLPVKSTETRNSSLPVKSTETRNSSLPVKSTETNNSHLNETTASVDTVYKQLNWHPGGGRGQTNVSSNSQNISTNSPDSYYREIQPPNIPAIKTFQPLSQDDVNLHKSQKEIQSLFRQKRQQLNDQLKRLQLEDNSDIETISEGPLSSSRGSSSTSIDLLSSLRELSSIRGMKEMSLTDVSGLRAGGSDHTRTEKQRTNGFHDGKDKSKDLTEISLKSRKDTGNLWQDFRGNTFSFNLSDDHGDTGDESSKSKISHIDLSSDEEY